MRLIQLESLEELALALSGCAPLSSVPVVFDAVWARQSLNQRVRADLLAGLTARGVHTLFLVSSLGNDEVECYLLDSLRIVSVPVLVEYRLGIPPLLLGSSLPAVNWMGYTVDGLGSGMLVSPGRPQPIADTASFDAALAAMLANPRCPSFGALFVAGDKSSVGKSSSCLALLSSLLRLGFRAADLAYIKPVTQCEAEQLVTRFCLQHGIACVGVGPVVFYKGFTRAFLAGETESSATLVERAAEAVRSLGADKRLVLVDGVGYPAVGSVCGISNADMALALGAPVLLVGRPGVGDAIDSYNLNASFFESRGVRVLGGLFNKLATDGFYSRDNCAEAVGAYFEQFKSAGLGQRAYGFVPLVDSDSMSMQVDTTSSNGNGQGQQEQSEAGSDFLTLLSGLWESHVSVRELLYDLWLAGSASAPSVAVAEPRLGHGHGHGHGLGVGAAGTNIEAPVAKRFRTLQPAYPVQAQAQAAIPPPGPKASSASASGSAKRTREEIEAASRAQGARGG